MNYLLNFLKSAFLKYSLVAAISAIAGYLSHDLREQRDFVVERLEESLDKVDAARDTWLVTSQNATRSMNPSDPNADLITREEALQMRLYADNLISVLNSSSTPSQQINLAMDAFRRDLQSVTGALTSYDETPESGDEIIQALQRASASGEQHRRAFQAVLGSSFQSLKISFF